MVLRTFAVQILLTGRKVCSAIAYGGELDVVLSFVQV